MAVVYRHIRLDKNEPFYIGIGKKQSRAYSKSYRNRHWTFITDKFEYRVDIVCDDVDYDTAKQIEKYLIKYYGRRDLGLGSLVNMTDGGDGGVNHSPETIEKIRKVHIGRKHSKEEKEKRADSNRGKKRTLLTRKRISESNKGKKHSKEHILKLSESHKGKCSSNAKRVIDLKTGKEYQSLRNACELNNLKYKTEHMRMKRNPDSSKNKFIYTQ